MTGIALNEPINYKAAYVCGHFLIFSHGNSSNSGFYTSEDGKNFVKIDSGFAINHLHSYTFINNSSVILISDDTDHVLYRSTDGGVTFTEYSSGQFPNRVINEVFVYIENTDLYQSADGVEWVHVDISPYTVNESTLSGDVYTTSANQLYRINVGMILPYEKDCYVKLR